MEKKVYAFCREHHLFKDGDTVVAGISGGVDSVALAHFLFKSPFKLNLIASHVNYGLRGQESIKDEEFVKRTAEAWGLPVRVERVPARYWKDNAGLTKQEAARNYRYHFFLSLAKELKADGIAVGHHRDDQAETVLWRMLRGSGLDGLAGMMPRRADGVVRPFLCVGKEEIIAYAGRHGLEWREDQSNRENTYNRNRIRNQLLPFLVEQYNPRIKEFLAELAGDLQLARKFWEEEVRSWLDKYGEGTEADFAWPCRPFLMLPLFLQLELMREIYVRKTGVTLPRAVAVSAGKFLIKARDGESLELPGGLEIYREQGDFHLGRRESDRIPDAEWEIPMGGSLEAEELPWKITSLVIPAGSVPAAVIKSAPAHMAYFDLEKMRKEEGIRVRPWRPGDKFRPLGMMGRHKKVQDLLVDRKISPADKERTLVFINGDEIIWVAGIQVSDSFKVTEETVLLLALFLEGKH
ncbi:MAG: tRNA lysidine(34) synthetase TilS [Bacillota bacterium]